MVCRNFGIRNLAFLCGAVLVLALSSHAQVEPSRPMAGNAGQIDSAQTQLHDLTDVQRQPGLDPAQVNAYKDFYKADEAAKKIELGNKFLQKYPKSPLDEPVDVGLLKAYYSNQDWKDVYISAANALALNPDDLYVLTTVSWLIPHVYQPDDSNANALLDTAESYAKHAIEIMPTMAKPSYMKDAQFTEMKAQSALQAHSALGLVYFRRNDFENSAKELQQASPSTANPDATDLFVLGVDLENLNRFSDAVSSYNRCGQITGPLQDRCKQSADAAKKQIPQSR
jgi:tetratricopeptide (TPR) repeat protein